MKKTLLSLVLVNLMLAGCSTTKPAEVVRNDTSSTSTTTNNSVNPDTGRTTTGTVDNTGGGKIDPIKDPSNILSKRNVYFDYDKYDVKDQYRNVVEAHGRFLASNPSRNVRVEGNADERGSREYNLALAQKRAEAVRRALTSYGANDKQVEAVSNGEEKPRAMGHDESAYTENRRADIFYAGE